MTKYLIYVATFILLSFASLEVAGHGSMLIPHNWVDTDGETGVSGGIAGHCTAGYHQPGFELGFGASCFWFNNWTFIPWEATLDPELWTYKDFQLQFLRNPWRSPGSAEIFSSCGYGGGNPFGCPVGGYDGEGWDCLGGGYSYGPNAADLTFSGAVTTEWRAGSVVEAMWGMVANIGGGYSYRLCKVPEEGKEALTEDCFQQNILTFSGDEQWVQYGNDVNNRIQFRANRTTEGTFPPGSQWTKNPIPACAGPDGGSAHNDESCPQGTQFPPPAPGLFGYGQSHTDDGQYSFFDFVIVDQLNVPEDLPPGEYVLSFRWDAEQFAAIWSMCSNIKIIQ